MSFFNPGVIQGIATGLNGLAGFIGASRQASAQRSYYQAVAAAEAKSRQNAIKLNASLTEVELKAAELRAGALEVNANNAYSNAFNQASAAQDILSQGNRLASFRVGEAKAAFAASGVANTGSASVALENIAENTFKDVDNQFQESINRVGAFLNEQAQLNYAAAMERYSAEVNTKFRTARVEAGLSS